MRGPWIWRVESFRDGELVMTTVHSGDHSKDLEVEIDRKLGKTSVVTDLRTGEVTE